MKKNTNTTSNTPTTSPDKSAKILDRFLSKLKESANGCLIYTGGKLKSGYGIFHNPIKGKSQLAHRFAFESYNEVSLRPDQYLSHKCDEPSCCSPFCLSVSTAKGNSEDMVAKGRSTKGRTKKQKRFTEAEKADIIKQSLAGVSNYAIAKQYSRAESVIGQFLKRHRPKPTPPPVQSEAVQESKKTTKRLANCYVRLNAQLRREAARKQWAPKVAA